MTTTEPVQITRRAQDLALEATEMLRGAQQLVIVTPDHYNAAAVALTSIKGLTKNIEEERFAQTRPLDDRKKSLIAAYAPTMQALINAEGLLKSGISRYRAEQERIRAARQREEDERAERERVRLEKLAEKAEERGDVAKAELFEQRAAVVAPAVVETATVKADGISERLIWKFEIVDAALIPRDYLIPDEKAIGGVVRSLNKRAENTIPGIRVWSEASIAARARE